MEDNGCSIYLFFLLIGEEEESYVCRIEMVRLMAIGEGDIDGFYIIVENVLLTKYHEIKEFPLLCHKTEHQNPEKRTSFLSQN